MIHIVLVKPQIPPNTGNIARLCAALEIKLHLVHPLGFSVDDRYLRRAGLDYWPYVDIEHHDNLDAFHEKYNGSTFYYLTTKSKRSYTSLEFKKGDFFIFGPETSGLDESLLREKKDNICTIPMTGQVRSLNLSSAVAMVAGEAIRQINYVSR